MTRIHNYSVTTYWKGNNKDIRKYDRTHVTSVTGKPDLQLTTDNRDVGDITKLNPEDLLVTAISSCHMLSYLYVCSLEGIVITEYRDAATGTMNEHEKSGSFKEVTLNPVCSVAMESMVERAIELHHNAHEICYIANSVNFQVHCIPVCKYVSDK
jgi:organic hydroperoxide reductase OsmC/OhrA